MKVLYKIAGQAQWSTLFDVAAGALLGVPDLMPEYKVSLRMLNYSAPGFGAPSQTVQPQANAAVTLSWRFEASYSASGGGSALAAAVKSTRLMQSTFAGAKVHLQVVQDDETEYYPYGSLESYDADVAGARVVHSFTFKTQAVTTTSP